MTNPHRITIKKIKLSRQETPNSVGGAKRIMYYNSGDDFNVDDDVGDHGDDDDDDDDDDGDDDDDDNDDVNDGNGNGDDDDAKR